MCRNVLRVESAIRDFIRPKVVQFPSMATISRSGRLPDELSRPGDGLVSLEFVDGLGVSAAAGSDLKRDGETFFPADPDEQRFQQLLVRAVLREDFHLYASFHRISTRR